MKSTGVSGRAETLVGAGRRRGGRVALSGDNEGEIGVTEPGLSDRQARGGFPPPSGPWGSPHG